MNTIPPYLRQIQIRTTQMTKNAVIEVTARIYRHNEVAQTTLAQRPEAPKSTNFISKWFSNPYFEGYAQGCEESRRVNFAQGYTEGYRNGRFVGRMEATGILFAMYTSNRIYHKFFG